MTTESIDDIAREVVYAVSQDELMASEGFEDMLAARSNYDPDDAEVDFAKEQFLRGFQQAVRLIEDPDEKERIEQALRDQTDAIFEGDEVTLRGTSLRSTGNY